MTTTPTVPPADDKQKRRHAYIGAEGVPVLIGGPDKLLTRAHATEHLRALRNTGRLAADQVTLVDYCVGEGGDQTVRNLGPVDTRFPSSGSREISRFVARAAGFGSGGDADDDEPPEAA
jgi:hypothetical protein